MAQPEAPTLLCVGLNSMNDNELLWQNNENCVADFNAIYIYEGTSYDGAFTLKKTITSQTQSIDVLSPPIPGSETFYYMQMECGGMLSEPSDTIGSYKPDEPFINKVSISSGVANVEWFPADDSDIAAYLIYRKGVQGFFELIDTVFIEDVNPSDLLLSYSDVLAEPSEGVLEYSISAMDFCGNSGSIVEDAAHQTAFLSFENDSCSNRILLNWTPYVGWEVQEYQIVKGATVITTIPASAFSYEYTITGSDSNPLDFSINAVNANDGITTSSSNMVSVDIDIAALPSYVQLLNANVVNTNQNQVQLNWILDASGSANSFIIYRGSVTSNMTQLVNLGPITIPPQTSEVDNTADTERSAYYYFLSAENDCGIAINSDTARTIFLNAQDNFDQSNTLSWNAFELGNKALIQQYTLSRIIDGNPEIIATFSDADELAYTDFISGVDADINGQYCYRVECTYDLPIQGGGGFQTYTTFSNLTCISQTSRIFMPNIFNPNGVNNIFKPVFVFPTRDEYSMIVINRWGEKVFETNNPDDGWDGYLGSDLAPQGVYAYVVKMRSSNGNQLERKGTVLLVR